MDFAWLLAGGAFFLCSWGFVRLAERLMSKDS